MSRKSDATWNLPSDVRKSRLSAAGVILLGVEVRLKRGVVSEEELKAAALSCREKHSQEVCTPPLHALMHTPSTVAKGPS